MSNGKFVAGRVKEYEGYLDCNYRPTKDDLVCEYYLEPAKGLTLEGAAQRIASESSIGTWTDIGTLDQKMFNELSPKVYYVNKKEGIVKIAYSKKLFEERNVAQIMSSIAGNIFGMSDVVNLKLLDIDFPDSFIKHYRGPHYGIPGVRNLLKIHDRPFVGTIVKPKIGLNEAAHAKVAYDAWVGGCDFVKDDENLTSMCFNNFYKRINATLRLRAKAERETGERKAYLANVTAPYGEMLKRAKHVVSQGGEFVMVDVLTVGWSAIQELRDQDLRVVYHGHRAMHAALTRNPKHGISMLVIAKLSRLIGIDQLHVGGIVGKMYEGKEEVTNVGEEIEHKVVHSHLATHRLKEDWHNLKPVLAVCSGGLHPGKIAPLIHAMGRDISIQAGGGIHGHPGGTVAGARAMRQAVDAEMSGQTAEEYAKTHSELRQALEKWEGLNFYQKHYKEHYKKIVKKK
ncbi:MAG: type III ribulose-bisphosphate carboxylase [archaeon]|jgi:ribulose-bisphosphate carboxylase large chain